MADKAGIRKIVSELGGLMGIPDLALDADDQCQLAIDGKIPVALEYDEDGERFILSSPVGSLPSERREPVLERLLDANLFWKDTGGAVLGLERKHGTVVLALSCAASNLQAVELQNVMGGFVSVAEYWLGELSGAATDGEADEESPDGIRV